MQQKSRNPIENSAQYIKGVGPKRYGLLNRLGIRTVENLLYYFPSRYEDRSKFTPISEVAPDTYQTVKGEVLAKGLRRAYRKGFLILEVAISDNTGVIYALWFNQPYLADIFKTGQSVILHGKVQLYQKRMQVNSPEYEILEKEDMPGIHTGRIVPIYPLTEDVTQRWLRKIIKDSLDNHAACLMDVLPKEIKLRQKLTDLNLAVKNIHFPRTFACLDGARRRLVFDEFFFLQLAIARNRMQRQECGISHEIDQRILEDFKKSLPFELTKDQVRAMKEIEKDMASPRPMNRLLQGDVGSGKTVVAAYSLLLTIKNGFQGALMVPTEILAEQHFITLSGLLVQFGVNVSLLVSGLSSDAKEKTRREIKEGEVDLVVGTHALIQEGVEFKNLGLMVVDEQHKFGVMQRAVLKEKGLNPDVLFTTATPIPRTLALTLYGDLDISTIKELPAGRGKVGTYWMGIGAREGIYKFAAERIRQGRQAYIVFPLIEESGQSGLPACTSVYKECSQGVFRDFNLGLLHGRMKAQEKREIMEKFRQKEIDALFATTILEVGIDVPDAAVMIVEDAERFGLSQLHQLRGRIGRGKEEGYCFLIADPKTEIGQSRLSAMANSKDGFELAEKDLSIRGPGEFFGTRQSGLPELKIGNLVTDLKILEAAKEEAQKALNADPDLSSPENSLLKGVLERRFSAKYALASI